MKTLARKVLEVVDDTLDDQEFSKRVAKMTIQKYVPLALEAAASRVDVPA